MNSEYDISDETFRVPSSHFAIQENWHLLSVLRDVERNPLRANLIGRAEDWRWSSLRARREPGHLLGPSLSPWPVPAPPDWLEQVNRPQDEQEQAALRRARDRGRPYRDDNWTKTTAVDIGVEHALRPREAEEGGGEDGLEPLTELPFSHRVQGETIRLGDRHGG